MTPSPTALVHLLTWLDEGLDEPFAAWCDDHHPELVALPGFQRGRRYVRVRSEAPDAPDYLTVYDLDDLAALETPEYTGRPGGGLPEFLRGHLRAERLDLALTGGHPGEVAGPYVAHLLVPAAAGTHHDLADALASADAGLGDVPGVRWTATYRAASGDQVALVDLADEVDPSTLPRLAGDEGPGWTVLRRQFLAHHGEGTDEGP